MIGTPQDVIAGIEALNQRHGFDRLFFWARPPGLGIEQSTRSLKHFAGHVLPHFEQSA